ncbi:biotin--[acetyl-CoA-carboxylase] synthetase [Candidatus Pantoea edessiphila]|uniref:Bifunctional ligase/repressor BirA n=1 Tax=Candidatus Pantoea edessiphila TaxID=2044610 RepID=A0A2P5SYB4_9GAMM|nr:bifunctional biotin--[acetyl-CoA-carboxylase] ligase/biotin operon repressor BirA [Candidatus Pantoea edessiphila]MBK4775553.1 bifunctional biotin--[acetyl-CoA-carboxylase] ligase/biotin operon repressor BirA [Pantoea sp. Edef]PPI87324.1 biotin--[acetyl-CoA-carboxylase] synthetase [Candidatus Pantoea edessiphila]
MDIKFNLINILADGKSHSIKNICKNLAISKSHLINNINILRSWGIDVFAPRITEYRLSRSLNLLNEQEMKSKLGNNNVLFKPVIDSTNQHLLDHGDNLKCGDLCVAEYQRFGRGRCGRTWYSSYGYNLCMSMYWKYWKIKYNINNISSIGLVIGVITAETLQFLGVKNIKLKWPNDIYVNDSKLAGILIELSNKTKEYKEYVEVVIGIGVNVNISNHYQKSTNVSPRWISLEEMGLKINRTDLVINLTNNFRESLHLLEAKGFYPFMHRWRMLDNFINKRVKLTIGNKEIFGVSRGIDNQGSLLLEYNGTIKSWSLGDISLRSF